MAIHTVELDIRTEDYDYSVDTAMAALFEGAGIERPLPWRVAGSHVDNWPKVLVRGEELELLQLMEAYYAGREIASIALSLHLTTGVA